MRLQVVVLAAASAAFAQVPNWPPTYNMAASTIIMPCNESGFTDPASTAGFGLIDFDWSNAKEMWAKQKPMDCEERLLTQVQMTKAAAPSTRVWVYRNSIKALPWYTSVRETLEDPAYSPWFLRFGNGINGSYHVPVCDNNYNPPLCSDYYHDQTQTPEFPHGDGTCAAPACDVGTVPVGEYIWDPRAANVTVYNQTFLDWFINSYVFNSNGGESPLVDGFFFDDDWSMSGPSEYEAHAVEDMGLSQTELANIVAAYRSNMEVIKATVIARGKFSWQQLYSNGGTCARPLVSKSNCASTLRSLCSASSPTQTQATMYAFAPGGCQGDPSNLVEFDQDLANFLLVRGPYAWLGHAWLGCSRTYVFPSQLNLDYGTPLGLCYESAPGSGVFARNWTNANVQMDCNSWTPTITMK